MSAILLAGFELRLLDRPRRPGSRAAPGTVSGASLSSFVGAITFAIGVMLVFSGALPTFGDRLAILSVRLPLWVLEASHFLGSLIGVLLLFLTRGLFHRLDGAWWIALCLSVVGLGMSVTKGLPYGEAIILALLILLLLATRRQSAVPPP